MDTFSDVIDRWPSAVALAEDLGEKPVTVRQWGNRNSIPADRWPALIDAASRRKFKGVSLETLARIAASKRAA